MHRRPRHRFVTEMYQKTDKEPPAEADHQTRGLHGLRSHFESAVTLAAQHGKRL
jgi:hypothetical protein